MRGCHLAVGETKPVEQRISVVTLGVFFGVFQGERLAADMQADPATHGRAAMALAYNVRAKGEVDPRMARAAAVGATILKPAREAPWLLGPDGGVTFR